jgi:hypothetical protein
MSPLDSAHPDNVLRTYIETFAGRADAYVRWTGTQYISVREPVTPELVVSALRDRRPIGGYFLTADNRSRLAALDLDRPDGWDLARRVGAWLWTHVGPVYVERSRAGRAHLWIVLASDSTTEVGSLPGLVLRFALRAALAAVGLEGSPAIELRPGADRLGRPDGLGHALRLPTMPHKSTGERHPLCDPRTGEPIGRTIGDMLAALGRAPASRIVDVAERYRPPASSVGETTRGSFPSRRTGSIDRFNAHVGVCEVLRREFSAERAVPGRTIRCPGHDDRTPSLSIARDDSRVWCRSPGCALEAGGRGQDAYGLWALARTNIP